MNDETRMTNDERQLGHSSFVIDSSFWFRHSDFGFSRRGLRRLLAPTRLQLINPPPGLCEAFAFLDEGLVDDAAEAGAAAAVAGGEDALHNFGDLHGLAGGLEDALDGFDQALRVADAAAAGEAA